MRPPDRALAGLALMLVGAVLGAACTVEAPIDEERERRAVGESAQLSGRVLLDMSQNFPEFRIVDLGTGRGVPLRSDALDEGFLSGVTMGPDGAVYAVMQTGEGGGAFRFEPTHSTLFRLGTDAAPQQIGSALPPDFSLVGVTESAIVVSSCGGRRRGAALLSIDADGTGRWRKLGAVCNAALSPDGSEIAFVRSPVRDPAIWRMPLGTGRLDMSAAERLTEPSDLMPFVHSGIVEIDIGSLRWGSSGIAAVVSDRVEDADRFGLLAVPLREDGSTDAAIALPLGNGAPFELTWQPHGTLLAFTQCFRCARFFRREPPSGELVVLDTSTRQVRQIAASRTEMLGLAWSPDGSSVVTRWTQGELLFVGPDGSVIRRDAIEGVPVTWGPA